MDGQYAAPFQSLAAFYPAGSPLMMPPEVLQPRLHPLHTLPFDHLGTQFHYDDFAQAMMPGTGSQRIRRRMTQGSDHVKHRRTRSGCYTCRLRRVKVGGRCALARGSRLTSIPVR